MKAYKHETELKDRLIEQAQRGIDRFVSVHVRVRRNEAAAKLIGRKAGKK